MLCKEILIQILHLSKFPTSAYLLQVAKLVKSFIELYAPLAHTVQDHVQRCRDFWFHLPFQAETSGHCL